jgi:putative redox protein
MAKPPATVVARWVRDHVFDAGRPDGPAIRLDGDAALGPSPVDTLLIALAGCTGYDVIDILAKRRTPVEALEIAVTGERADAVRARVTAIRLDFRLRGAGIERAQAERAIELAVAKYCSVRESLDPAMPVDWTLTLDA